MILAVADHIEEGQVGNKERMGGVCGQARGDAGIEQDLAHALDALAVKQEMEARLHRAVRQAVGGDAGLRHAPHIVHVGAFDGAVCLLHPLLERPGAA